MSKIVVEEGRLKITVSCGDASISHSSIALNAVIKLLDAIQYPEFDEETTSRLKRQSADVINAYVEEVLLSDG